jgi:hypothetical protein
MANEDLEGFMCAVVTVIVYKLSETVVVVCSYECKCPINPVTNPNLVSSDTYHVGIYCV